MPYLNRDVTSLVNYGQVYAKAGTEIIVVSQHGSVLIVRPKAGGIGFWIPPNYLSDEPIPIETQTDHTGNPAVDAPAQQLAPKKTTAVRRPRRTEPHDRKHSSDLPGQSSLF